MDIKTFNIKLDLNLSNVKDVVRLQNLINYSLNLNIGLSQTNQKEVNVIITKIKSTINLSI